MAGPVTPDLCVIGAGAAGLSVALAAAASGARVVLIERGKPGGTHLNHGDLLAKALLAATRRRASGEKVDFAKAMADTRDVVAAIAPNVSVQRLTGLGVRVIAAAARFADMQTVSAGGIEIKARRFVIATGSRPAIPLIPGLAGTAFLTNETIFELNECPQHLLVLGADIAGIELAQVFRRLGAAVTVIDAAAPLAKEDPECAAIVLDQLARDGVAFRSGAAVAQVRTVDGKVELALASGDTTETVQGSHLLIATGRTPNIDELALPAARIYFSETGVTVDKRLRTTGNKRVYAIGEAIGGPDFTHVAHYHASLVVRQTLLGLRDTVSYREVPRAVFTDPELAHVGLSEAAARRRRRPIRVLRWAYHDNDRARAERNTRGHVKVIVDAKGQILGATIVGDRATELISTWTLALAQNLNIGALAGLAVPYPTLSEAGKHAATAYFAPSLRRSLLQRIVRLLRWPR